LVTPLKYFRILLPLKRILLGGGITVTTSPLVLRATRRFAYAAQPGWLIECYGKSNRVNIPELMTQLITMMGRWLRKQKWIH